MKKVLMYLGVLGLLAFSAQGAFAWDISNLNPLPYVGIGQNTSSFSLNPFTGFKNCNPCKKVVKKCNPCATGAAAPIYYAPCQKQIPKCNRCNHSVIVPMERIQLDTPQCPTCTKRY